MVITLLRPAYLGRDGREGWKEGRGKDREELATCTYLSACSLSYLNDIALVVRQCLCKLYDSWVYYYYRTVAAIGQQTLPPPGGEEGGEEGGRS